MMPGIPAHPMLRLILQLASLLVPRTERATWLAGWSSELWYVCQELNIAHIGPRPSRLLRYTAIFGRGRSRVTMIAFCLGSLTDALSLRRENLASGSQPAFQTRDPRSVAGSAMNCLRLLTLVALASFAAALLLPGARAALTPTPPHGLHVLLVAPEGSVQNIEPQVPLSEFRQWRARSQHLFRDFAFYQPTRKPVHIAPHVVPELNLARSTPNLFHLLGSPVLFSPASFPSTQPRLILSEHLWRTGFHADAGIFGQSINVGLHPATLAGYLPDQAWQLPGRFDAWLLEPDAEAEALSSLSRGFVLATLVPSTEHASFGDRWSFSVQQPDGGFAPFDCISPSALVPRPVNTFLFTTFLALLALPATTSLSLGEYPSCTDRLSPRSRLRRWFFLATKVGLLGPAIYLASVDLAYGLPSLTTDQHQYVQIVTSFSLTLFALRWALRDQRRRCPVCLTILTRPARVGQPSRNFLAWNGLELICAGGHGLLHVPELPTSWFHTQRWLSLDPSWSALFLHPS